MRVGARERVGWSEGAAARAPKPAEAQQEAEAHWERGNPKEGHEELLAEVRGSARDRHNT
jgi:hypothetical protein